MAGHAPAQQIVPDGRTATNLSIHGNVTDVTTATRSGSNAFNSFSRFNVDGGNVVNLHVPTSAANLVNIVRDERTNIHGILNSIQDGRIGGSVFFANPHGLLVGAQGVINVGRLSVATPTQDFVDNFFLAPGDPNEQAVQQLLAGTAPRNGTGLISIDGTVNAIDDVRLLAGTIDVGGSLYAGARFIGDAPSFSDVVNTNGIDSATNVVIKEGRILLVADSDITLSGTVAAPGGAGVDGGEISIRGGGDVALNAGAHVTARGNGGSSGGGTVDIWADNDTSFYQGAAIDVRAGASGDGGFIELSAGRKVTVAGGQFKAGAEQGRAGSILIDPEEIDLVAFDFTDGADFSLIANDRITVGAGVIVSTRDLADVDTEDHLTAASQGNSGDLALKASHIVLEGGAKLLAHGNNGHAGGDVTVEAVHVNAIGADRTASASVKAENATITGHDVTVSALAETSGITQLLQQTPDISLEDAQKSLDDEADDLSDGPGGEYLAIKTSATASNELYGVKIDGSGAVNIAATAGARAGFEKNATAEVIVGDLLAADGTTVLASSNIQGGTVDMASRSDTSLTFNVLGNALRLADQSWLPAEDSGELQLLNDQLFDFSSIPLVSLSQSDARTVISGATVIGAADSVTISSDGISAAKPTFSSPLLFSAAWGESTVTAHTSVGGTTEINAANKAAVTAATDTEVNVTADVVSINKPIDAVFVRAKNTATTTAEVGGNTVTTAGSVDVTASAKADISAAGLAKNAGGSGVGIAVAVNESITTTTATLGGDITATLGDVAVEATTDVRKNSTAAEAATLGNPNTLSAKITNLQAGIQRNVVGGILGATGKVDAAKADRISQFMFPGIKEGKFNASGAVAYSDSENTATASIAPGATVRAEGGIDAKSSIEDRPNASVGAKATSTGTAIGGSAVIANFANTANAFIGADATVDARGALRVDAQTKVPYPWEIDWNSPAVILNHLQDGILDLLLTSYAINSASGKDGVGLAAAVNVFGLENNSNAYIDEGARINTVYDKDAQDLPEQSVSVYAKNDVNTVNAVGILSKKFLGTSGGKAAIGGSANIIDITGTATATIRGDAEVKSENGVIVEAESLNRLVSVAEAGGSSDKIGIEGALSMNTVANTTIAAIDDDATVDTDGSLNVAAGSDVQTISVAGGVVATKGPVGIGMSVSLNTLDSDTRAFIGNFDPLTTDLAPAMGDIAVGGDVTVKATSETEIGAYSVAGALATNSSAQTDVPTDAQQTQDGAGSAGGSSNAGQGKFGIAVSGDASVNTVDSDTLAYIADGVAVSQAENVGLNAGNTLAINALSGAVTISTQQEGNSLAGSYAQNTLGGVTAAYVSDAELTLTGDLDVGADVSGEVNTLSASLAGTKGKVGVAGSVSVNEIANRTEAYVARSSIHDVQALTLSALDGSSIRSIAGAVAFGGKAGVGLSFAWNKLDNDTKAYLDESDADADGGVSVSATTDNSIDTISAAIGASNGQMAAAGAVSINTITNTTDTYIDGKKTAAGVDAAGTIAVEARDDSSIFAVAGSFAAATGQAGVGVSFAWSDVGNTVGAEIRGGADVESTAGDVEVKADSGTEIDAIAAGGGVANKVGVAASVSVVQATNTVSAGIEGSKVAADGNVLVTADDDVRIFSLAGNIAGGGKVAIGVSNSTLITDNTVEAGIGGDAEVSAAGNRAADEVYTGRKDGDRTTEQRKGVVVSATSHENIQTIAAGGSGAGSAGIAGSATVTLLDETTTATIGAGAKVNETNTGASAEQDVLVRASDETELLGVAGAVAFGGSAGVGAGADVGIITKNTEAAIESSSAAPTVVNAKNTVMVEARNADDILSISASLSAGGSAGIAGSASVYDLTNTTTARIGDSAQVFSDGNVVVAADDATELDIIAGNAAVGGSAGVGASAGVSIVNKTTRATIDADAEVTALGNAAGVDVADGSYGVSFVADAAEEGEVSAPETDSEPDQTTSDSEAIGQQRLASANTTQVKGVAVTATNKNDIESISATGAIGGSAAVTLAGNVNVINTETTAAIADGAQINQDNSGAGAEQSVVVAAGTDHYHMGIAGSVSGGGAVGIGVGADVLVASHTTKALVGDSADVRARRDVVVSAAAQEEILSISAGLGVSGTVGVAGSAAVISIDNNTEALTGAASTIDAGGNVRVAASDDTETDLIVGTVAIGLGAAGVGGSVGVTTISKDTTAGVGEGATVNARGNDTGSTTAYSGDDLDDTDAIKGLAVEATSSEDVLAVAAAGAGGFYAGVSGAVTVETIDSNTTAAIGADADINKGVNDGHAQQDVNVSARNAVKLQAGTGALGIGAAGVAGGVDVASVRNDTSASIGDGAEVYANRDVDVNALSATDLDSVVVSAGGGIVGVAGAVAVYSVGSGLDQESKDRLATDDNDEFDDVNSYADDQAADGSVGSLLAGSNDSNIQDIGARAQTTRSEVSVSGDLADGAPSGNSAFIGTATVEAGRHIDVDARQQVDVNVITGALAIGGVGLGAGIGVVGVNGANQAFIAGGAQLSAGGDVAVTAASGTDGNVDAYVGSGGIVAIDAGVAIYSDETTTAAYVGDAAHVTKADAVDIDALDRRTVTAHAFGASVGAAAAGASVSEAAIGGTVQASIGTDVQIGQGADQVHDVSVTADSESRAESDAEAAKAGLGLAAGGAVSTATADAEVIASIGAGAEVTVQNAVDVDATGKISADAAALGINVSLGSSVGASVALAKASPRITASVGNNATIEAHSLSIDATQAVLGSGTRAHATGASGGLMVGVNATVATAENTGEVEASIGDDSTLTVTGAAQVRADNRSQQHSSAEGLSFGLLALGANVAETKSNTRSHATLGDDVSVSGGSLALVATGRDVSVADAVAGSGGAVSGAAASANTSSVADTRATTGSGSDTRRIAVGTLDIRAAHTTQFNGSVDSLNASLVGASGAIAQHSVNSAVRAGIGDGGRVSANNVDIAAENKSHKFWLGANSVAQDAATRPDNAAWNINSGSGGLIDLPAGSSKTHLTHATTAGIGADADMHVLMPAVGHGLFSMDAYNEIIVHDKAKLDSGGAVAVAKAVSHAVVDNAAASVVFGENSRVVSDLGDINAGARSAVDLATRSSADTYGLAGAPSGEAYSIYNGLNQAVVNDGARIVADDGNVFLAAGQGSDGASNSIVANANVNLWNKTAIPIDTDPDAQSNIVNNAAVGVLGTSSVQSGGNISLFADKGIVSANATGIGKDIYRETAAALASGISNLFGGGDVSFDVHGGSTSVGGSANVTVNGTLLAGIHRTESLTLDFELLPDGACSNPPCWRRIATATDGVSFDVDPGVGIAANIQSRIDKLRSLMAQYAGDPVAVAAYQSEIAFLEHKLVELGLASRQDDGSINVGQWNNPSPREIVRGEILTLQSDVSEFTTTVTTAGGTVVTTTTSALGTVTTISDNVDTIVSTHATLAANNGDIKTRLAGLSGFDPDAPPVDYGTLESKLAENQGLQADIAGLKALNVTDQTEAGTRNGQIDTLVGEIATLEGQLTTHVNALALGDVDAASRIVTVQSQIDAKQSQVGLLTTELNDLLGEISTRNADINAKSATIALNGTQIDGLQVSLADALRDTDDSGDTTLFNEIGVLRTSNVSLRDTIGTRSTENAGNQTTYLGFVGTVSMQDATIGSTLGDPDLANFTAQISAKATELPGLSDVAANGPIADFVHVDDITVRLGNINVKGDNLLGSGELRAPGDAQINITNNTPNFLVVNDLTVLSDEGGTLRLNGVLVNGNADINRVNRIGLGANFSHVVTRDVQSAPKPAVTITSNYDPDGAAYANLPAPAPNIELNGDITNLRGSVTVHSKAGSILSNGLVRAGTVDVKAENGDFVQSFVDNFYHVGGDPASIHDHGTPLGTGIIANGSVFVSARYLNINSLIQSGIEQWTVTLPADGAMLLTGPASFYGVSQATLDAALHDFTNGGSQFVNLTPAGAPGGALLRYNAAAKRLEANVRYATYDTTTADWATRTAGLNGLYPLVQSGTDNIGANLDPVANRFVLDGEAVRGGYIQLFGQILNTSNNGAGKLRVLDGYGQISIDNPTGRAVVLNRLDAGADPTGTGRGTAGKIDITDIRVIHADNSSDVIHTVYTRDYDVGSGTANVNLEQELGRIESDGTFTLFGTLFDGDDPLAADGRNTHYHPKNDLRFVWTTGTDNSSVKYWQFRGPQLFGFRTSQPTGTVTSESGPFVLNSYRLDDGTYLSTGGDLGGSHAGDPHFASTSTTRQSGTSTWVKTKEWTNCNWWTACIASTYNSKWTQTTPNKTITTKSLNADYPIAIEFMGWDQGTVTVDSASSVILNGEIRNNAGATTINSTGGSIIQNNDTALITSNDLTLAAAGSVGTALGVDPARSIQTSLTGVLDASAGNGNVLITQTVGDLKVGTVTAAGTPTSDSGKVILQSDGSIVGDSGASLIQGGRVELTSGSGGIGAIDAPLAVNVGYVDNLNDRRFYGLRAEAAGDIGIETGSWSGNTAGDLLVDRVVSVGGDVMLAAPGRILDNNPLEQIDTRTWDELLNFWDSLGLREGEASNDAKQAQAVSGFENGVTQDYRLYWLIRGRQVDGGASYDPTFQYAVTATEREALSAQAMDAADITAFEASRTAQYHELNTEVGTLNGGVFDPTFQYAATDAEQQEILKGSSWTDRELGISITPGLLKDITNTNPVVKAPNVEGRNVTLDAGVAVGETLAGIDIPTDIDPATLTDAQKVALAAAERSDLTITDDLITVSQRKPLNFDALDSFNVLVSPAVSTHPDNGMAFLASLGGARLGAIQAPGETRIKVRGSIVNAAGGSLVQTGDLVLEAANGGIGYIPGDGVNPEQSLPLHVDLLPEATLTARAAGDVDIVEDDGDLNVDTVYSRQDAALAAEGSILDAHAPLVPPANLVRESELNVLADNITLSAFTGSIGDSGNALDAGVGLDGRITASAPTVGAGGGVYLHGPIGSSFNVGAVDSGDAIELSADIDMLLDGLVQGPGAIGLVAGGALRMTPDAHVHATTLGLLVNAGALFMEDDGTDAAHMTIDVGTTSINAAGDAVITGISTGNPTESAIEINAGGSILDGGDVYLDIVADAPPAAKLTMTAGGTIGGNPLDVQVLNLEAVAGGLVHIDEQDSVHVDHIQTDGELVLNASAGSITGGFIGAGSASLLARDLIDLGTIEAVDFANLEAARIEVDLVDAGSANLLATNSINLGTAWIDALLNLEAARIEVDLVDAGSANLLATNSINLGTAWIDALLNLEADRIDAGFIDAGSANLLATTSINIGTLQVDSSVNARAGRIDAGIIDAESADLFAYDSIRVADLRIGSLLNLAGDHIVAGVTHTGTDGMLAASLGGPGGGAATFVDLEMTSPIDIAFDGFRVLDGSLLVPDTFLRVKEMFVGNRFTVDNGETFLVIDHTTVRPDHSADIQLYAGGELFAFDLSGTVLQTDPRITRKRKGKTHTVIPFLPDAVSTCPEKWTPVCGSGVGSPPGKRPKSLPAARR